MPLDNFLLMNMYTILKDRQSHTKKHLLKYFKTFPISNCWSTISDNVILITINPLKFGGGVTCNCSCFEIDQEMDAILLIIDI